MSKIRHITRHITPFNLLLLSICVAACLALYIAYVNWSVKSSLTSSLPGHEIVATDQKADLRVTVFYDYKCPWCFQMDPLVREAAKEDGKVDLIFKFLPFFGEDSRELARMAYAAGRQDKFIDYHDYVMQGKLRALDEDAVKKLTDDLGLDHERFVADYSSEKAAVKIQNNKDEALFVGVGSTPTLLIGETFFVPEDRMPTAQEIVDLFNKERNRS